MYHTIQTLTREVIENARGNEVSVKRADGAVFTVRKQDAMRYYVRDTRADNSRVSGFAIGMAQVLERINGEPGATISDLIPQSPEFWQ